MGEKAAGLSPLPNGECQSLGGVQGALFKGQPCWGSRPQTAGATPPLHPVGRKCAFDGRKAVKSAFALLSQKVTKARRWRGGKEVIDLKRTISAMVGQGSVNHNSRAFNAKNTDRSALPLEYNLLPRKYQDGFP